MNYFIIDGEGLTKKGNEPYELGYCIVNDEGEILIKRDFFFPHFMKQNVMATFASDNFDYYMERKKSREFIMVWDLDSDFLSVLKKDLESTNARVFLAWKASVDWNFLCSICGEERIKNWFGRWYDISNGAAFDNDYVEWCYKTNNVSEKGYPRFNVDTCLLYLNGDDYRPEVHRGIEDCIDEANLAIRFGLNNYEKWTTDAGQLWRRFK